MANPIRQLGQRSLNLVQEAGGMMIFLLEGLSLAFAPPFRVRRVLQEIQNIGVRSTLIVMLTAAFTGMVMALQGYYTLRCFLPLILQPPSTLVAKVLVPPKSEPDWSSVKQIVPIFSPFIAGTRILCLMLSLPKRAMK